MDGSGFQAFYSARSMFAANFCFFYPCGGIKQYPDRWIGKKKKKKKTIKFNFLIIGWWSERFLLDLGYPTFY